VFYIDYTCLEAGPLVTRTHLFNLPITAIGVAIQNSTVLVYSSTELWLVDVKGDKPIRLLYSTPSVSVSASDYYFKVGTHRSFLTSMQLNLPVFILIARLSSSPSGPLRETNERCSWLIYHLCITESLQSSAGRPDLCSLPE
jgi:hypothetical protein